LGTSGEGVEGLQYLENGYPENEHGAAIRQVKPNSQLI
jgi:hypothetical protein